MQKLFSDFCARIVDSVDVLPRRFERGRCYGWYLSGIG